MTTNYKEAPIVGTEWVRCGTIQIVNPHQRTPAISFVEEKVTSLGEGREPLFASLGAITVPFDPAKTIAVLNPETNEDTGRVMTYGEVYAVLYSAYIAEAIRRDERVAAAEEAAQDEADRDVAAANHQELGE